MVIIYDAKCRFCTNFAMWCKRKNNSFKILDVRSAEAKKKLREQGYRFIDLFSIYYIEDGNTKRKSKAIFAIIKHFGYPTRFLSIFCVLPTKFTDYIYTIVSKYRHRL